MTRYLLVRHDGKDYRLPETVVSQEVHLHDAFELNPELFPTDELNLGQLMVVGREVAFESGNADLICVDDSGQVVIIEMKRGTENPDSRRVVAQMLDYGSHLWGWTFEKFQSEIALPYFRRCQKSAAPSTLQEAAAARLNLEDIGGPDGFEGALAANLEAGTFTYVVVARTLPSTLATVLRYLAKVSRLQTAAIIVDYFRDQDREILVPRVAFSSAQVQGTNSPGKTNERGFLLSVGPAAEFWTRFMEFLDTIPGKTSWGKKGFSYRMVVDGKHHSVVYGYPRTAWWLQNKGLGDELSILVSTEGDLPDELKRRVASVAESVRTLPGGRPSSEGKSRYVVFKVKDELPKATEEGLREALKTMFTNGS